MTSRRLIRLGLLAALLLPFRLAATSVEPPAFDTLVARADYVVRAVVKSVNSEWRTAPDGRRYIASKVELDVREVIQGTPPSPLVLDLVGGRVGEDELTITGAPKFYVGEENILFIHGNGQIFYPLVGIMHGVYPVLRDTKTGQSHVLRSNGMPLYSEADVSLPMDKISVARQQNPSAQPLTVSAFTQQIRTQATRGLPRTHEK